MPIFGPILYSAYIYLACKNTRFFPLLQTFLAKILLPPAFFSFSAGWGVSAFLQTKCGRKGKNALSGARYLQKKEVLA